MAGNKNNMTILLIILGVVAASGILGAIGYLNYLARVSPSIIHENELPANADNGKTD